MLGKYQNIFRSRWKAATWALGVLLTAYCTVPSAEPQGPDKPAPAERQRVNPWALEKPAR